MQMAADPFSPKPAKIGPAKIGPAKTGLTTISQNRIRQSFARGLASYHAAALAQAQIATLLAQALHAAGAPPQFQNALEFGCGTGLFTDALLQHFAIERLMLNDLVEEPAATLQPILQHHKTQTTFHAGPIETLPLPMGMDLIASASTVQWVADPAALIARLAYHLSPGGWLALSGFGTNHFAELRAIGGGARAPSYLDPQDWRALLPPGLQLHSVVTRSIMLQFPTAISLLKHLRQTGVNAGLHRHWTKTNLAEFDANLRASQQSDGDIRLTYSPVLLIAQKSR